MLITYLCIQKSSSSMTDSMNFGPEWLRNLSSEGSTGTGSGGGTRYQLADYRYGREEMLALFEKGLRAPNSLTNFSPLYSEQVLPPLALIPPTDDDRGWQSSRVITAAGVMRGRGSSLERGGRISRGRGPYQPYGRGGYDGSGSWGATEQSEWSPRKDYNSRTASVDNWRRNRGTDDDDGWRNNNHTRGISEKWGRSMSWRDGSEGSEERGPPERSNRSSWQESTRGGLLQRRPWESEDHLPEWAMENPSESGGSFDSSGAFHGSDDEQRDQKQIPLNKREIPLQKSISQQNIVTKSYPTTLPSSQSAVSLSKPPDDNKIEEKTKDQDKDVDNQTNDQVHFAAKVEKRKIQKVTDIELEQLKQPEQPPPNLSKITNENITAHMNNMEIVNGIGDPDLNNRVEEEFDRLQEDLVKKLVVDEETPKRINMDNYGVSGPQTNVVPPPNLNQPVQDKWYYQDPQGDLQGPFLSHEMAEWFRAGYFTSPLLVKRHCDERFHHLGDLVTMCGGNPFQCNVRISPLKLEVPPPAPENNLLQFQMMQRQLVYRQANVRAINQTEPWANMPPIQRDLVNPSVLVRPQMTPDISFLQQPQPPTNPLMHMINQMQQVNKLSAPLLPEKQPTSVPQQLDSLQALVQQMGGLQSIANNLQTGPTPGLPTTIPSSVGLSGNLQNSGLSTNLSNSGLLNNYQNLSTSSLPIPVGMSVSGGIPGSGGLLVSGTGLHNNVNIPVTSGVLTSGTGLSSNESLPNSGGISGSGLSVSLQSGLPTGLTDNTLSTRTNSLGAVDPMSSNEESDKIKDLIRRWVSKHQTEQLDSLWPQSQFPNTVPPKQWQQNETPLSMWDLQAPNIPVAATVPNDKQSVTTSEQLKNQEKERQKQLKEAQEKEQKRKREEEKQAKREAEEKKKEEQRKLEAEKRAAEEKRKKEEERIKKELERSKKEAEEKRLRELEEKRRLKELRKVEEEMRKKIEEQKRLEEAEKIKRELKEKEEQLRQQAEAVYNENNVRLVRNAPWNQTNSTPELSLADIQKAEREKRAEQAALLQQQRAQQILQEQQATLEKQSLQFTWAKKPPEAAKVKTLSEIQQEEQDRLAKQAAEARLAQHKDREIIHSVINVTQSVPWNSSNITWASTAAQWSNSGGFWDEASIQKSPNKPSSVTKSSSTSAVNINKQVVKPNKCKTKKDEQHVMKLFSNGPATDEFTEWCTSALKKLNSTVDIPTFISFLRDIESALDVREYCKEYLGERPTTQQFASQFLEKRRMIKPKIVTQKDDMSSPAPAITPSAQHNTDFQEVKGKGKKIKKSRMTKVDSRILGFSVTAAPDRLNVGERDYVEN
ncbi:hypothetical protein FQA39_LY07046 [Lamprigera yunnana]|nr:hypothetical protein FQA39_LY07046 [Lamprigera yunnana]